METKKWRINEKGIIKSMEAVLKTGDIDKLTKDCYNFTMNISGFIAHYNHGGFMAEYRNVADLIANLERSSDLSRPEYYLEDFFQKEQAEYYQAKSRILSAFKSLVEKYKNQNATKETEMVEDKWELLKEITKRDFNTKEKKNLLLEFNLI